MPITTPVYHATTTTAMSTPDGDFDMLLFDDEAEHAVLSPDTETPPTPTSPVTNHEDDLKTEDTKDSVQDVVDK